MYEQICFIKDFRIYDTTDRCIKKCICANVLWLLSVLLFTYGVIIYRCLKVPGNYGSKIYGING